MRTHPHVLGEVVVQKEAPEGDGLGFGGAGAAGGRGGQELGEVSLVVGGDQAHSRVQVDQEVPVRGGRGKISYEGLES